MARYWRWVVLGLVVIVVVALWVLVSANDNLRKKLEAYMLEKIVRNKVQDLREKAAVAAAQAKEGEVSAAEAEKTAASVAQQVAQHKTELQTALAIRGMDADEIAARLRDLTL